MASKFDALERRVDELLRKQAKAKMDAILRRLYDEMQLGTSAGARHFPEFAEITRRLEQMGTEIIEKNAKGKLWGDIEQGAINRLKEVANGG